jgi:hypothetical protein
VTNLKAYTPPTTLAPAARSELFAERALNIETSSDREYLAGTTAMGRSSSEQSWVNYNRIGEVRYAISRSARIAGYARLQGEYLSRTGEVESIAERGVVADEVAQIYGKFGGTRGMIERFYTLMKIPAESYPIWVTEAGMRDGMWFLSPHEIDQSSILPNGKVDSSRAVKWITGRLNGGPGGEQFTRSVEAADWIGRIWTPSKQYTDECDSPMTALNDWCEMLDTLTQSIMGRLRQRFALAGLLLIPNEISDAAINGPAKPNQYSSDKVMNYLITIMTRNVTQHDNALGQIPAILKGPADALDKVRHIILDTQIAETDIKLRSELISRILDGLDQQKQASTGGEGTNHWGMWAVSDEERRITVQPDLEALCHGLTKMVLWRRLQERGWDAAKIRRWRIGYDLSQSAVKTNVGEDARQAYDRGVVNADFVRKSIGASADDAMTADEYVRWVGVKLNDPVLATYELEGGIEVAMLPVRSSTKQPGPNPDSPGDPSRVGPGVGEPGSPASRDSDAPKAEEPG